MSKIDLKHSSTLERHIKENRPLTTFEVSRICGVVHTTVSNWIEAGRLHAYRTPGGHRRIPIRDLVIFLKLFDMPIPKQLLDWLETHSANENPSS